MSFYVISATNKNDTILDLQDQNNKIYTAGGLLKLI
jgi:hypothetical protein